MKRGRKKEYRENIHPFLYGRLNRDSAIESGWNERYPSLIEAGVPHVGVLPSTMHHLSAGAMLKTLELAKRNDIFSNEILMNQAFVDDTISRTGESGVEFVSQLSSDRPEMLFQGNYLAWLANGKHTFFETADLHKLLKQTDLGDVPSSMIHFPFDSFYLAFDPNACNFYLDFPDTGEHQVDGVYIRRIDANAYEKAKDQWQVSHQGHPLAMSHISKLDNYTDYLAISVVCTPNGSGRSNFQAIHFSSLIPMDPKTSVGHELKRVLSHKDFLRKDFADNKRLLDMVENVLEDYGDSNIEAQQAAVEHALKFILYLSMCGLNHTEQVPEYDQAQRKGKHLGKKKRAKANNMKNRAINAIYIHPRESEQVNGSVSDGSRSVSPHYRRAHFRSVACGVGRTERRIKWIPATIVNKAALTSGEEPGSKEYIVG